jgi:hypothetical protein
MCQPSIFKKDRPIQAMNLFGDNPFFSISLFNFLVEQVGFSR